MAEATICTHGERPSVRLERILKDPPQIVWTALTNREELAAWFPCDVEVEGGKWVEGAKITFEFPKDVIDMTLYGQVQAVDEPHLLVYSWGDDDVLRFELQPDGSGTKLILIDELPKKNAARNAAGWDVCLDRFMGKVRNDDAWHPIFDAYVAIFEPVLGSQDGPPLEHKASH